MCQLLVGLPAVNVLGVADLLPSLPLVVHVETVLGVAERCPSCETPARVKDRDRVALVDLPVFPELDSWWEHADWRSGR